MEASLALLAGETPIKNAPPVKLENGRNCIPQHYLVFEHSLSSVEQLVLAIEFDHKYPIFVSEDNQGIYIQIGIIGFDNYQPRAKQTELKIVYGRRWRVEQQLPTSEIIQTVFLAIKTAREHEIRELFFLESNGRQTTPFNNHHDLPLMAQYSELVQNTISLATRSISELDDLERIGSLLERVSYDQAKFHWVNVQRITSEKWLVELAIKPTELTALPELRSTHICFVVDNISDNELLFQLMSELIRRSNQHVEETFRYKGFARFSRQNNVAAISRLSSQVRKIDHLKSEQVAFLETFKQSNYDTDLTRVPKIKQGPLGNKIRDNLQSFGALNGILPG